MTDFKARIEQLNANAPHFIRLLGGRVIALDRAAHKRFLPLPCHWITAIR